MAGVVITVWLICAFLGALIGSSKGQTVAGFFLGLLLGVIGLIIVVFLKPAEGHETRSSGRVPCPHCAEQIMPAATVCPHCNRDVDPSALPAPPSGTAKGWIPDPSGRHPDRYWDGRAWTHWVRDKPGGTRSEDPPVPSPAA